jgi:hypothetical protein
MTRRLPYELVLSLAAVAVVAGWYAYAAQEGAPPSGGLVGHGLGILGFLMMLSTETLYTLRKNLRRFTLGQMSTWLHWHIFTGIVGPLLVLLHSAGRFNGLAGVAMILTVVMVLSGFVGRYIYTATPRTLGGTEVGETDLEEEMAATDRQLRGLAGTAQLGLPAEAPPPGWQAVLARPWLRWRHRRRLHRVLANVRTQDPVAAAELEKLLTRRYRLQLQIHSLAATRRLLALWHLFHVPLGGVLFSLAFIHVGGALYYATFLK